MPPENTCEISENSSMCLLSSNEVARPLPGDEVVITGISGKFPDSDNMHQYQENLMTKTDMVTEDNRRWSLNHPQIPKRTGKIFGVSKFDAGFFGVHSKQATAMDPMLRILYEKTYECILDAGINPLELKGKNVGVFVGACFSEAEKNWFYEDLFKNSYGVTGCIRSAIPQRISHWLGLNGPSYVIDSACSSSLFAFEHAYRAIRNNLCESAFVGGVNTCLHPYVSLQFSRLGVLSPDGKCKSFDENADGYARSETICMAYLQKAKDARRVYATVVHSKTNCDGYKDMGITFPSAQMQQILYEEIYSECQVDPKTVEFMEAHGTGTKVGDPEEILSIDKIFCTGRDRPMPVGSVKSNIGHTEPSSGLASIAKIIIAMETGIIPPNLHFNKPRDELTAIIEGRLNVVTEKLKWNGGLVGLNNFGFGGANCHTLLKWNEKSKPNILEEKETLYPRLVCLSGRTASYIDSFFNDIKSNPADIEQIRLIHEIHRNDICGHVQRAYLLLNINRNKQGTVIKESRKKFFDKTRKKLVLNFDSYMGGDYSKIIHELSEIEIFQDAFKSFANFTDSKNKNNQEFAYFLIQMAFVSVFKTIRLEFATIKAKTLHESILALYCDSIITIKEAFFLHKTRNIRFIENLSNQSSKIIRIDEIEQSLTNENHSIVNIDIQDSKKSKVIKNHSIDSRDSLLIGLGEFFLNGSNFDLHLLYPHISFPVSRSTRMIAPLIQWNHDNEWLTIYFKIQEKINSGERSIRITMANEELAFLGGHVIDGRNLIPATGYLEFVWETLALMKGDIYHEVSVVFENVKFLRATHIPKQGNLDMIVMVHKITGNFEIFEGGSSIVTGRAYIPKSEVKFASQHLLEPTLTYEPNEHIKEMSSKDIYKELRLRGYNYNGMFRSIEESEVTGKIGKVKWENKWVPFLDSLLQISIIQIDTRGTIVPTAIDKLTIDVNKHYKECEKYNNILPIHTFAHLRVIRSGGAEIVGIEANIIPKKRLLAEPVLESYEFVPQTIIDDSYPLKNSIRNFVQIALENVSGIKVKTLEIIDKDCENTELPIVSEIIFDCLGDLPLIQAEMYLFLDEKNEDLNLNAEKKINVITDRKMTSETNCLIVVVTNGMSRQNSNQFLNQVLTCLRDNAFVISRESKDYDSSDFNDSNYCVCQEHTNATEKLILLKKIHSESPTYIYKQISSSEFAWVPELQATIKTMKKNEKIVLVSENEDFSGALGFVNCLRREQSYDSIVCIYVHDRNAPAFADNPTFYETQLKRNLAINVYENGEWGTYRHLLLFDADNDTRTIECQHAYVNVTTRGDLSSLSWIQGPLSEAEPSDIEKCLVYVHYSALNFRDIMTATGRLSVEVLFNERLKQECVQGLEFSGLDKNGNRVMGMVAYGGLGTILHADKYLLWKVPSHWSLEDAATVPIVYSTCLATLVMIGKIRKGQSILIHAGTGGIGQAAIILCIHYGLEIFTTVGTDEKKQFIRDNFPEIPESHIGNSRDISFEKMIMQETNGRGVDFLLNSLAEEKLQASVRCLAPRGRFLEIGKFDLAKNTQLSTDLFTKGCSFNSEVLDALFNGSPEIKKDLFDLVQLGLDNGSIRPLKRTTFANNEVEKAFRFMGTGKHIGKVLVRVRSDDEIDPKSGLYKIEPEIKPLLRFYPSDEESVYIIIGGLGGFGLELADWLIIRGVKKLILTSRVGVSNGYQSYRTKIWRDYGVHVHISTADVTNLDGCRHLIETAQKLGRVEGIFNLAVVLKDALFENQNADDFEMSFKPKAFVAKHMDRVTREQCPDLKYFVLFSSVSCGRGNAGQTNYGMANSVMERVCESRIRDGHPALAIEWGAIGEVGLVADMQDNNLELEIGGTLQQKVVSCLETLDLLLLKTKNVPIVSSMVVAEKKSGTYGSGNLVDTVAHIMGIRDLKNISLNSTLAELGMDSMMAVEIKQTLEREFEIFLTAQDIRSMTFRKLIDMSTAKENEGAESTSENANDFELATKGLKLLIRTIGDEELAKKPLVEISTKNNDIEKHNSLPKVIYFPGVEGMSTVIHPLAEKIFATNFCLQLPYNVKMTTFEDISSYLLPYVQTVLGDEQEFIFVAYSYGTIVALDLCIKLESLGMRGRLVLIDGSPFMMKKLYEQRITTNEEITLQTTMIASIIGLYATIDLREYHDLLYDPELDYNGRVDLVLSHAPKSIPHSKEHQKSVCVAIYDRIKALAQYQQSYEKCIRSKILLLKPSEKTVQDIDDDYELSKLLVEENVIEIRNVADTDHTNILDHDSTAEYINHFIL